MFLHQKIYELRKSSGWSQEELAEKCDVSRQSVSKWEVGQSVPELDKILLLSKLFNVSTDYLINDEMECKEITHSAMPQTSCTAEAPQEDTSVHITKQEAEEFIDARLSWVQKFSFGVGLCIVSPIIMLLLIGASETRLLAISEDMAGAIGTITTILFVIPAVAIFITRYNALKKFSYMDEQSITPSSAVTELARLKKENFRPDYSKKITTGVILCIIAGIVMLTGAFTEDFLQKDYVLFFIPFVLIIVAVAVHYFITANTIMGTFDRLLQEGNFSVENKQTEKLIDKVASVYWPVVVAIYLGYSFITFNWHISWIIWPVAGVLFGAVAAACNLFQKEK